MLGIVYKRKGRILLDFGQVIFLILLCPLVEACEVMSLQKKHRVFWQGWLINCLLISSVYAVEVGQIAPSIEWKTATQTRALSHYRGKVVYLDFWASWCAPCQASFLWMNEMQAKFKKQGLEIIAINVDVDQKNAIQFLKNNPASFSIGFDQKDIISKNFGIKGLPSSVLIGRKGEIVWIHAGFNPAQKTHLENRIRLALGSQK